MTVRGRPLNRQQTEAVSGNDPTRLVLAGAGTGKTTTLIGRVKRLVEEGADPSSMLLISLTNNTVADLRRALDEEFGEGFGASVMTIHALGNRIAGRRPCVGQARTDMLARIMSELASRDAAFAGDLLQWAEGMRSAGYGDMCYSGESIGSRGLRAIADELFRRRIGFVYERASYTQKGYVQAHIDVESVGLRITADDRVVRDAARDPYEALAFVARVFPKAEPMSRGELAQALLGTWGDRLPSSVGSMISRCKCARRTVADLGKAMYAAPDGERDRLASRLRALDRIWDVYAMECSSNGLADFEDMVILSESMVRAGYVPPFSYEHVLIDEYQDATPILVDLIRSLRRIWGFDLFCAGDDWQSIYSFSGGDVWQTYGFDTYWKDWSPVSVRRIERTYRYPQQLADMAGRFVSKNPSQLRKTIKGEPSDAYPVQLLPVEGDRDIAGMIANRLAQIPDDESVFIIGRTRADIYALGNGAGQFEFQSPGTSGTVDVRLRRLNSMDEWVSVRGARYLTAHSSKGLEADWVFLIADRERGSGFPSMTSDPMDALFLRRPEGIDLAEERRVFYVAMTRARKGLFIVNRMEEGMGLTATGAFTSEIVADEGRFLVRSTPLCPECLGPMRIIEGENGLFYGCCSYPGCRGTRPIRGRPFRG